MPPAIIGFWIRCAEHHPRGKPFGKNFRLVLLLEVHKSICKNLFIMHILFLKRFAKVDNILQNPNQLPPKHLPNLRAPLWWHEVFISIYESGTYISHNGLSVKADIGRRMDPVFQDKKTGAGSEGHIDRGVIVSEDKVIYVMNRGELLCKLHKRFIGTTELICLFMRKPIAFRPSVSETKGKPRMQQTM